MSYITKLKRAKRFDFDSLVAALDQNYAQATLRIKRSKRDTKTYKKGIHDKQALDHLIQLAVFLKK